MTSTAAGILIDSLQDWDVQVIFGLPGDGINGIMESLRRRHEQIRFIQVRREEAPAFMAPELGTVFSIAGLLGYIRPREPRAAEDVPPLLAKRRALEESGDG